MSEGTLRFGYQYNFTGPLGTTTGWQTITPLDSVKLTELLDFIELRAAEPASRLCIVCVVWILNLLSEATFRTTKLQIVNALLYSVQISRLDLPKVLISRIYSIDKTIEILRIKIEWTLT